DTTLAVYVSQLSGMIYEFSFFFQAEDGIRDRNVTGVQTCALPIFASAFALSRLISVQAERTFERLRYSFGGDRPSQTAHLTMSPSPLQGCWVEFQDHKDGIPTSTPHRPKPMLPSVPSTLCIQHRTPISGYSKAPWGLGVLSRVTGIFAGTTISPGGLLRQCPNHYAFHAGQNLPDKEFRYLRTVIVTADVHWGFNSMLSHLLLTFQHR